jgi:hypothetical protein
MDPLNCFARCILISNVTREPPVPQRGTGRPPRAGWHSLLVVQSPEVYLIVLLVCA